MRILWFTNTPSLAAEKVSNTYSVGSSWIESLERGMLSLPNIELGIAFSWNTPKMNRFQLEGHPSRYFMIPSYPIGKWSKYWRRIRCLPEPRKALQNYLKVVDEFQPDIIHFFGTESIFPLITPYLKVPSVIWFQGNLTVYHTKWESGFSLWKVFRYEKWWDILNGESFLQDFYLDAKLVKREKEIFSQAKNFTGRTDWDRRLVSVMAPQANYYHCEEAMRPDFYERQWTPQPEREKFTLLTTIRSNTYKGLEVLMEASKKLTSLIPKKIEWRVVGIKTDDPYVRASKSKANYTPSDNSVIFLGFRSADELAEELLDADLYVHPSHIDNSPNSVCEAMLMGLPVVSTNAGGIPSLIKEHREGLLVQSGDSYALAGAILDIYKDPENAAKMGANARKRGLKRNDVGKICSNLTSIYERIIEKM